MTIKLKSDATGGQMPEVTVIYGSEIKTVQAEEGEILGNALMKHMILLL